MLILELERNHKEADTEFFYDSYFKNDGISLSFLPKNQYKITVLEYSVSVLQNEYCYLYTSEVNLFKVVLSPSKKNLLFASLKAL